MDKFLIVNKIYCHLIGPEFRNIKIANVVFYSEYVIGVLSMESDLFVLNYTKGVTLFKHRMVDHRFFDGQILSFNNKIVMNRFNEILAFTETATED